MGALIWKYVAAIFGYEHGIIAWGIGAAVGVGASMFGSKGLSTGVICVVFALLAILGGKYMAMESFQSSWSEDITTAIEGQEEEFKQFYQQDLKAAAAFSEGVEGREELLSFLNEHGYMEIYEVDEITDAEIADFNEYVVPHLKNIAEQKSSFEQWLQGSFQENLEDVSTMELVKSDIGIIGIIFFLLGIGSAFKIGKGDEFGILLKNCPLSKGTSIANTICESITGYEMDWEDEKLSVGISVGVVGIDFHDNDFNRVLRFADMACYMAKNKGGSQVYLFEEPLFELNSSDSLPSPV